MNPDLKSYQKRWPLSDVWSPAESFTKDFSTGEFTVHLVGLCSYHQEGTVVTTLAADLGGVPLRKAYLDLLKKTSVVEAELSLKHTYPTMDLQGQSGEGLASIKVFPLSPDPDQWQYASWSAVSADEDLRAACFSAKTELIERDRVLRSWFGETRPVPLILPANFFHRALVAQYDFQAFHFPESGDANAIKVVAIYGFPRRPIIPTICGFGAGRFIEEALVQAQKKCFQCLGSLWGEEIPETPPPFSPTAEYHQEVFLRPSGVGRIKRWLSGEHVSLANYHGAQVRPTEETRFVDLTPAGLKGKIYVVKAVGTNCVPLTFGTSRLNAPANFPADLLVHPLA